MLHAREAIWTHINKADDVCGESTILRIQHSEFSQGLHDEKHHDTNDGKADENTRRPTVGERTASADEETLNANQIQFDVMASILTAPMAPPMAIILV